MFNNVITTTGSSSFGIQAGENGRISGTNTNVTSSGGGAALFVQAFNSGYGSIALTDSIVRAQGANTSGLASLNLSAVFTTLANLTNSYLTSEEDAVILGVGGPLSVTSTGSTLVAQNGLLIDAQFNAVAPQQTVVNLSAAQSQLSGNVHANGIRLRKVL